MKRKNTPDYIRLFSYLLRTKKILFLGIGATMGLALTEAITGIFYKNLISFLKKIPESDYFSPYRFSFKIPLGKGFSQKLFKTSIDSKNDIFYFIIILTIFFIVIFISRGVFQYLRNVFMNMAIFHVMKDIKTAIYNSIAKLPKKYFDKNKNGDIISRITFDVSMVEEYLSIIIEFSRMMVYFIFLIPLLFITSKELTLALLFFYPLSALVAKAYKKRISKASTDITDNVGDYTAFLEDRINSRMMLKSLKMSNNEALNFKKLIDDNYSKNVKNIKLLSLLKPINETIALVFISLLILYFGYEIVNGSIELENAVLFLYLSRTMYKPVKKAARAYGDLQVVQASSRKIFNLLDQMKNNEKESWTVSPGSLSLIIEGLSFSYDGITNIINNFSLKAKKGDVIAFTGPSGSGKTTLLEVIHGFYESSKGEIIITTDKIHSNTPLIMNFQEQHFPMISVDELLNLFPQKNKSVLLRKWRQDLFNKHKDSFPMKELSAGEQQKLSLAITLSHDAPIIILDEPANALDKQLRKELLKIIHEISKDKIILIATHINEIKDICNKTISLNKSKYFNT